MTASSGAVEPDCCGSALLASFTSGPIALGRARFSDSCARSQWQIGPQTGPAQDHANFEDEAMTMVKKLQPGVNGKAIERWERGRRHLGTSRRYHWRDFGGIALCLWVWNKDADSGLLRWCNSFFLIVSTVFCEAALNVPVSHVMRDIVEVERVDPSRSGADLGNYRSSEGGRDPGEDVSVHSGALSPLHRGADWRLPAYLGGER